MITAVNGETYPPVDEGLVEEQNCLVADTLFHPAALCLSVKLHNPPLDHVSIGECNNVPVS